METSLFDYHLPADRIAQRPLLDREASRLLVLDRDGLRHAVFREFPDLVPEGALVVLNDTRVRKARVVGTRRGSGGKAELLLIRREGARGNEETWVALGHANRRIEAGAVIDASGLSVEVTERSEQGLLRVLVRAPEGVAAALERTGHVPLPPYIKRPDDSDDADRYQTVFAERPGSAAAPTAGLHFTSATLGRLRARGIELGAVTLHVGLGTFRPVTAEDLDRHPMHAEEYEISADLAEKVKRCRLAGGSVVAIGTTVVRALESARDPSDPKLVRAVRGETSLLIQPGYSFGPVDAMLTNFHMPKSTLVALVAAFAGRERVLSAYRTAIESGYRFLSYGDAMWIPARVEAS